MRSIRHYILLLGTILLAYGCREKTPDDFEFWGLDVSRHQRNINW